MRVQVACKEEGQNDHDDYAYADWVIAPVFTVRPNRKTTHQRDDNGYGKNEEERHDFTASLTVAVRSRAASIWAGTAT